MKWIRGRFLLITLIGVLITVSGCNPETQEELIQENSESKEETWLDENISLVDTELIDIKIDRRYVIGTTALNTEEFLKENEEIKDVKEDMDSEILILTMSKKDYKQRVEKERKETEWLLNSIVGNIEGVKSLEYSKNFKGIDVLIEEGLFTEEKIFEILNYVNLYIELYEVSIGQKLGIVPITIKEDSSGVMSRYLYPEGIVE